MKEDTTPIDPTWLTKNGGYARDMTLHDYYAGLAMQHMGLPLKVYGTGRRGDNAWSLEEVKEGFPYEDMAKIAYKWADAMLKAREGK